MNLITIALAVIIALLISVALYIFVIKPRYVNSEYDNEEPPPLPPTEGYEESSESLPPLPV